MSNVVILPCVTRLDLPPDRILERAMGKLGGVLVAGFDKDTGESYVATSYADGGDLLWLLEIVRVEVLRAGKVLDE